jgi:prepilin-type N-terminal cleavage/methylation domain-containing protein
MISVNNMDNNKRKKISGGFTLIELVVAILVFAIGIVGIMKMHQASLQANNFSMQLTQAMNITEDRIDYLRGVGLSHADMTLGAHGPVVRTSMGVQYQVTWAVSVTPNTYNVGRNVNLAVSWNEKTIAHNLPIQVTFIP